MKKHLPNFITLVNLFSGSMAAVAVLEGETYLVAFFIGLGLFADFMDGLVARRLNVSGTLGKELDSLADMVTFGFVPGMMLFHLIRNATESTDIIGLPMFGFLLTVAAGYRLAKFNIDERQTVNFLGLPTPAGTSFVFGIWMTCQLDLFGLKTYLSNPYLLIGLAIGIGLLLISDLLLFGNKMKTFGWKGNEYRFIFLGGSLINFALFGWLAFSLNILFYLVLSLIFRNKFSKD